MADRFYLKKQKVVKALAVPDDDYADASPKGSVDAGVRDLIALINDTPAFVTTSSCAGRIAVYLEGPPKQTVSQALLDSEDRATSIPSQHGLSSNAGGKGGGKWLFTSHSPVDLNTIANPGQLFHMFGFPPDSEVSSPSMEAGVQFVHFKFEPMILHILASTAEDAQAALKAALPAGFRESGISSLFDSKGHPTTPIVAVRSSGLALDSIIGYVGSDGESGASVLHPMVSEPYLRTTLQLGNQRFATNEERKLRFSEAFSQIRPMANHDGRRGVNRAAKEQYDRRKDMNRRPDNEHTGGALNDVHPDVTTQSMDDEPDYDLSTLLNGDVEHDEITKIANTS